jgi:serine phosphatase RsbU (regulator of sigma subunit)
VRLSWANAGHPPPVLVTAGGTGDSGGTGGVEGPDAVRVLGADVGDLMLGVDPRAERVEHELWLDRPATLLLYTDGLVERRGSTLDEGTARLRAHLAALADRPLDELCDALLDRVLPTTPQDDVALVAVRLGV